MASRIVHRYARPARAVLASARAMAVPVPAPTPPSALSSPTPLSPLRFRRSPISLHFHSELEGRRWLSSPGWVDPPPGGVVEVPLAQTGEGIAECELLKWFVEEGDHVEEFQPLCEVQSDKATIEITSRFKGKVLNLLSSPGDIVKVGETLLKILVNENQASFTSEDDVSKISHDHEVCESVRPGLQIDEVAVEGVLCTPAVRHLAKQYGLDINVIPGTGKNGRVLKEDVLKYATSKGIFVESPTLEHASSDEPVLLKEGESLYVNIADEQCYEDKRITLRGFQRAMVKSMTMAATVPHFHYLEEINCDALVELKAAFQNQKTNQDIKHTFLPFLVKSLSMALTKHPLLNSTFCEDSTEVVLKGCHNIGVAMATSYGLVVPNIKTVQSLSILEITKELARLQHLATNNKLNSDDITGGTITLSNIGAIGGKFGSPLLNLPEVAIIAIGRIQKLPRFADDGTVYPASIANVAIGADHRVVDGAAVARFCNEWKLLIEQPELLLLHMR